MPHRFFSASNVLKGTFSKITNFSHDVIVVIKGCPSFCWEICTMSADLSFVLVVFLSVAISFPYSVQIAYFGFWNGCMYLFWLQLHFPVVSLYLIRKKSFTFLPIEQAFLIGQRKNSVPLLSYLSYWFTRLLCRRCLIPLKYDSKEPIFRSFFQIAQ